VVTIQELDVVYLGPAEAARRLGVSRASVWRWAASGHLRSVRLGPRCMRVAVPAKLIQLAPIPADPPRAA
jgi:excisionase family DNA binding protein